MIYIEVDERIFENAFKSAERDVFTPGGYVALYNHLKTISRNTGKNIRLDVHTLSRDFVEYKYFEQIQEAHSKLQLVNIEELEKLYICYCF